MASAATDGKGQHHSIGWACVLSENDGSRRSDGLEHVTRGFYDILTPLCDAPTA